MLFWLIKHNLESLERAGFGFLRVFTFVEFQAVGAVLMSFFVTLLAGPKVIAGLRRMRIGDRPAFDQPDINAKMAHKADTPTMGGVLILVAIASATLVLADIRNFHIQIALICLLGLGLIGAVDDWLKLTAGRRGGGRQGLSSIEKLLFQFGLAILLTYFTWRYGQQVPARNFLYSLSQEVSVSEPIQSEKINIQTSLASPTKNIEKKQPLNQTFQSFSPLSSIKSLDDIDQKVVLQEEKSVHEDNIRFTPISIEKIRFDYAYKDLLRLIENKPSIKTILDRNDYSVQENIWKQVVFNDFEKNTLENTKEELLHFV
ncbi:MAG: hypothetical protein NZ561_07395, partial [Phycisphaerae bacterium]|nr:hypothetical protein [Phycisphaerae bacterium]